MTQRGLFASYGTLVNQLNYLDLSDLLLVFNLKNAGLEQVSSQVLSSSIISSLKNLSSLIRTQTSSKPVCCPIPMSLYHLGKRKRKEYRALVMQWKFLQTTTSGSIAYDRVSVQGWLLISASGDFGQLAHS